MVDVIGIAVGVVAVIVPRKLCNVWHRRSIREVGSGMGLYAQDGAGRG